MALTDLIGCTSTLVSTIVVAAVVVLTLIVARSIVLSRWALLLTIAANFTTHVVVILGTRGLLGVTVASVISLVKTTTTTNLTLVTTIFMNVATTANFTFLAIILLIITISRRPPSILFLDLRRRRIASVLIARTLATGVRSALVFRPGLLLVIGLLVAALLAFALGLALSHLVW